MQGTLQSYHTGQWCLHKVSTKIPDCSTALEPIFLRDYVSDLFYDLCESDSITNFETFASNIRESKYQGIQSLETLAKEQDQLTPEQQEELLKTLSGFNWWHLWLKMADAFFKLDHTILGISTKVLHRESGPVLL